MLTGVLFFLYPLAIWFALTNFSTRVVGLLIVGGVVPVMVVRFRKANREDLFAALRIPLVVLAVVLLGVFFDDSRFVLAMPVMVNSALLLTFAASLAGTPTIERFARMQDSELSPPRVRHCRQVTYAWILFFGFNASTALVLSLTAPVFVWAAYNGGIAYGLMGAMFVGEYIVRQYRFRSYGAGLHDRLLSRIFPPNPVIEDRDVPT